MALLSFPVKTRKGAGLENKMNENYHEMWNVALLYLPESPKFYKQSSCALSIYKQIFAYVVQHIYSRFFNSQLECWNHWDNFCMYIYDMCMPIVLSVASDDRPSGFRSWLHHVMDVWIWASFLTSLYLRCVLCKMRMMIIFTSWRLLNSELYNTYKTPRKVSEISEALNHLLILVIA